MEVIKIETNQLNFKGIIPKKNIHYVENESYKKKIVRKGDGDYLIKIDNIFEDEVIGLIESYNEFDLIELNNVNNIEDKEVYIEFLNPNAKLGVYQVEITIYL